jgi:hypothetical protein
MYEMYTKLNHMSSTCWVKRKKQQNTMQKTNNDEESHNYVIVPTSTDILCGRGRTHFSHPGNKQFREIVGKSLGAYLDASTRTQKSKIVKNITNEALEHGARFLKQERKSKVWYIAGLKLAREKVRRAQVVFGLQNESSAHRLKVKSQTLISGRLVTH